MPPERRWHLTSSQLVPALLAELSRALPLSRHEAERPGVVVSSIASEEECAPVGLAFAAQTLPSLIDLGAPSIQGWSRVLFDRLTDALGDHHGPWRLHALALDSVLAGRARLIEQALVAQLKAKLRRLERTRVSDFARPWQPDEALIQFALTSADMGVLSVVLPAQRRRLDRALSRFPRGEVVTPRDTRPPSRAYRKLLEAELRLGHAITPGETCVDLGASPGGWTHVALARGARVVAVDRSELRADLMENSRLRFVEGDAFAWRPEQPIDWLLCDLIAFPERTMELLDTWLSKRLCRRFVVTLKFRGDADYARVDDLQRLLNRHATGHRVVHLRANKNEVTAMGELAPLPRAILFDLDGVLVRSHEAWFRVSVAAGQQFRGSPVTWEEFEPAFGQSTASDIASFGLRCSVEELDAYFTAHFARYLEHVWTDPGAAGLLESLRRKGLRLAVVTNTVTPLALQILEAAQLRSAFEVIAGADQAPNAKPAPDLLHRTCAALGVPEAETWMIGDSRFDRGAAAAAGVHFVGLGHDGDHRIERLADLDALVSLGPDAGTPATALPKAGR